MYKSYLSILILAIGLFSCGYQTSFQKQKYLKGHLKQTFGEDTKVNSDHNDLSDYRSDKNEISAPVEHIPFVETHENDVLIETEQIHVSDQEERIPLGVEKIPAKPELTVLDQNESKSHSFRSRRDFETWLVFWTGMFVILFGLCAPLLFGLIGWWSILIAFVSILLGTFIMVLSANIAGGDSGLGILYVGIVSGLIGLGGLALWGIGGLIKWLIE